MSESLRVHTDSDGIVWCGQNGVGAYCTDFSPDEFVATSVFKTAPVVRVMGSAENSKLLLTMYEKHKKAPALAKRKIWLASPAICPTKRLRDDPTEVLHRMWQSDTTARISANWHVMDAVDFNAYLLRMSVDRDWTGEGITDKARVIFQYHPAFSALTFLETVDIPLAVKMLSLILDPRWYVHAERPNRLSKLMRFMGMTPANFKDDLREHSGHDRSRAAVVCNSWFRKGCVDYNSPRSFLWRIFVHHGGGHVGKLKASEAFIRFIVLHWLENLHAVTYSTNRKLFDPELFFKTSKEIRAYNTHISGIRS